MEASIGTPDRVAPSQDGISTPPAAAAFEAPAGVPHAEPAPVRRSRRSVLVLVLGAIALIGVALYLYVPRLFEVDTDDAFVDAHVVSVVPKVAAYVSALHISDNSTFAAGALLVELDPRDFEVARDRAAADLENAIANAANVEAQLPEQQAVIAQAEAAVLGDRAMLAFAEQQLRRYGSLATTGAGTTEQWQQAQSDVGQRQANLQRDLAAVDAARAHVAVLRSQVQQAQATIDEQRAALAQARLNLSYTKIFATEAGTVANKSVEVGNFVQPGQVLFSAVPDTVYVTANYKETQLTHVRAGQPVMIRIDAFPGVALHGHVDSIQRGTGSQFALLPPENATGNFVKVVQRVPVKVVFDGPGETLRLLSPGMSVEATIMIARPPWWLRFLG
jgi:membrane fusion protein, multidrug efflux system